MSLAATQDQLVLTPMCLIYRGNIVILVRCLLLVLEQLKAAQSRGWAVAYHAVLFAFVHIFGSDETVILIYAA